MKKTEMWMLKELGWTLILAFLAAGAERALGQNGPEKDGLRFQRFDGKTLETLARKAGGPTERIEIQSTDDHRDYVVKTYVLKKANASEVYQLVLNAIQLEGGTVDRIAPGSLVTCKNRENASVVYSGESILVVTAPMWMIPYLDETIEALDREDLEAAAFGTGSAYIFPRHRRPSELAALISEATASGVEVFVADDSRNILYLEDSPSYFPGVLEALNVFDAAPSQIEVRVRIFEIDESNGRDVGLDWYAWKKAIGGGLTLGKEEITGRDVLNGAVDRYETNLRSVAGEITFNPLLATEFLNYLADRGNAKVITDSRITLVNGEMGLVQSVKQIPYVLRGFIDNGVADSPLRDSPEALDPDLLIKEFTEGLTLEMVPTIGADTIILDIRSSVATHVGYTPNQSVPIITRSEVKSQAVLEADKPTVVGGLTRMSEVTERSGICGLSAIPGLRHLFSREVQREHTGHIIITVHLIRLQSARHQAKGRS